MKINNSTVYHNPNSSVSHKAGLSRQFAEHAQTANWYKISQALKKEGIQSDFKGNSVVAACVEKVVQIFKDYKLGLPTEVKFEPLEKDTLGLFTLYDENNRVVSINSDYAHFYDIYELNRQSDVNQNFHNNHFLETFIHEFAHNAHYCNLLKMHGLEETAQISKQLNNMQMGNLWAKFKTEYAKTNMKEYIAESITKKITKNLDDNLNYRKEPKLDYTPRPPENFRNYAFGNYAGGTPAPRTVYDKDIFESVHDTESAIWDGDIKYLMLHGSGIKGRFNYTEINSIKNTFNKFFK